MADNFSTASLGLKVDIKQFNTNMDKARAATVTALDDMRLSADSFGDRWNDLTNGIKDTKRIISGILVSRGFYSLLEGLTLGTSAALSFAANMQTAAISMEYFVQGADKANKATAFLREINTFAARTPFSTEEAISLSKYIQAMGMSIGTVKSYLTVVTDTAAATGATTENLQRITLALGQMLTKGRLANEEIRQLANANIPIYEILQEELKLTGSQISNIGKYWVDANTGVNAILTGLEKRYKGAADRVADTFTGMVDTIIDNAKIISTEAGHGIFDGMNEGLAKVRDQLDSYRETVTNLGSAGLFNQILVDLDATGQVGTEILTLMGNARQLGAALRDLYIAGQPLISLFGKGLHASISVATITATSFSRVVESVLAEMRELGLTTGEVAQVLTSLYVTYKAAKWMITLGEGAAYATLKIVDTANSLTLLLPASIRARAGVAAVTGGLLSMAAAGLAVWAMLNQLNSFAGLDLDSTGMFPDDYETAMDEYTKKMAAYNESIEKYTTQFNSPYSTIVEGANAATASMGDVEDASKKAAKSVKNDWTAAFDEVYTIPEDKAAAGGDKKDKNELFPDLGELLKMPKIVFPDISDSFKLEMPEFPWDQVFGGSLLDNTALNRDWWKTALPGLITFGVVGAAKAVATSRRRNTAIRAGEDTGRTVSSTVSENIKDIKATEATVEEHLKKISKLDEIISEETKRVRSFADNKNRFVGAGKTTGTLLEGTANKLEATLKELVTEVNAANKLNALLGKPFISGDRPDAQGALRQASVITVKNRLEEISTILRRGATTAEEASSLAAEQTTLLKQIKKLGITPNGMRDIGILGLDDTLALLDSTAGELTDTFNKVFTGAAMTVNGRRKFNTEGIAEVKALTEDFLAIGDQYKLLLGNADAAVTTGTQVFTTLDAVRKDAYKAFKALLGNGDNSLKALDKIVASISRLDATNTSSALLEKYKEVLSKVAENESILRTINEQLQNYEPSRIDDLNEKAEQIRINLEEKKRLDKLAADKAMADRKALAEALDKQAKAAHPGYVRNSGKDLNAHYADELAKISRNTEDTAIRLADMADGKTKTADLIKEAKADMRAAVKSINELSTKSPDLPYAVAELKRAADALKELGGSFTVTQSDLLKTFGYGNNAASNADKLQAIYAAIEARLEASNLPKTAAEAVYEVLNKLPASLKNLTNTADIAASSLFMSGTKLDVALKGIGSFDGDIPSLIAGILSPTNESFKKIMQAQASAYVQTTAALGNSLEAFITNAAKDNLMPTIGKILSGGFALSDDGKVLAQIDSTLALFDELGKNAKVIPNDIKTMSDKAFNELLEGAVDFRAGVKKITAEHLAAVKPAYASQFGAQSYAMDSASKGNRLVGMTVFNRDFDFTEVDAALVERWKTLMHRKGLTGKSGGRIFSADAVSEYANMFEGQFKNVSEATEAYFADVIQKLLNTANGIDTRPIQTATQQLVVEYSNAFFSQLNIPATAKAFSDYASLIGTVVNNDNISDFLHAYVQLNKEAGKEILALNFSPVLRHYGKMLGNQNKWLRNILKTDDKFSPKAIGRPLATAIDELVAEYTGAVTKAASFEDAAKLAGSFSDKLEQLAKAAEVYGKGGSLDGDFADIFKGTKASIDDMALVSEALSKLGSQTNLVNKVPRLIRSTVDGVAKLNKSIAKNATVTADNLYGLGKSVEQVFSLLGMSTEKASSEIIKQIYSMHEIAKRAGGKAAFGGMFDALALPFDVLGMSDTLKYATTEINEAVSSGVLKVADNLVADFKRLSSNTGDTAVKFIGQLNDAINDKLGRFIIDLEATGLITPTLSGTQMPDVSQVALYDTATDKVYSWLVDYGARNPEILSMMQNIYDKNGELSDVSKEWLSKTTEQLNTGKNIQQILSEVKSIVGDDLVSGYNAVNVGHMGGAYDIQIIESIMGKGFLNLGKDVMEMVSEELAKITGTFTNLKLTEAYSMISGGSGAGAHDAGTDVKMTGDVLKALKDGTFEKIANMAAETGFEGGLKQSLLAAGRAYRASIGGLTDEVVQVASDAATAAADTARITGTVVNEAVEDAAKTAAKSATETAASIVDEATTQAAHLSRSFKTKLSDMFKGIKAGDFGSAADALEGTFENLKTFWTKMRSSNVGFKETAKVLSDTGALFDAFDELAVAAKNFNPIRTTFNKAMFDVSAGAASKSDDWVKQAAKEYAAASKEYSEVSTKFYRTIIEQTAGGIDGLRNIDLFKVGDELDAGVKYIAYSIDSKTGALKLFNDTLLSTVDDIKLNMQTSMLKFAQDAGLTADTVKQGLKELDLLHQGVITADSLTSAGKVMNEAYEAIGKTTTILDAAGNVKYAGTEAAAAIEGASKAVGSSFKTLTQKAITGVAGFGALDIVGLIIDASLQAGAQNKREDYLQSLFKATDSSGVASELEGTGVDVGRLIGENIYNGIASVLLQEGTASALGGVVATTLAGAMASGVGTIPALIVGAVGAGVSMLASAGMRATGGRTDTNLYLDDYLKQLENGGLLNDEIVSKMEAAMGRALTKSEKSSIESEMRSVLNKELIFTAKDTFWDRDELNKIFYGQDTSSKMMQNAGNDDEAILRIASALGILNKDKYGSYSENITRDVKADYLTVKDEAALDELKKILGANLELVKISDTDGYKVLNTATDTFIKAVDSSYSAGLSELINMVYSGGITTGEAASKLQELIAGNKAIETAIYEKYGSSTVEAIKNLDSYLSLYNSANGTSYTREQVDAQGLSQQMVQQMVTIYDAYIATWLAQAKQQGTDTDNRNRLDGSVSATVWNGNLQGVTDETIAKLAKFGIALSEGTVTIDSSLAGVTEQTFLRIDTAADMLKNKLAGWTIDTSKYSGLDFSKLKLTATDVEVLASAGIQINGDGSVTFMKAMNEEMTGAARELNIGADSFSNAIMTALGKSKIGIDFEAKSLTFDKSVLESNMAGAMFALPASIQNSLNDDMRKVLAGLGNIMDSGYFNITNKSILSGKMTVEEYIKSVDSNMSTLSPKVLEAFQNIDALIATEGNTASGNIIEWANGIVVPSPIRAEQVTPEIEAAFREIGISFEKYGEQFMMVINQTGEHITNGVTLIDKEKWLALDEDVRKAFEGPEGLGVTVTEQGNQVMVDLSNTFNNGIHDVISLFTEQPEEWAKIPDTVKQYLEEAGIVTQDQLLKLDIIAKGGLTPISDGWISTWESISNDTKKWQMTTVGGTKVSLADLEAAAKDGLLKVSKVVGEDFDFSTLTKNQIAVPFESLPKEIQDALGSQGLEGELRGKKVILENATQTAFAGMMETLRSTTTDATNEATSMAESIAAAISETLANLQSLNNIKLGKTGGFLGIGSKENTRGQAVYAKSDTKKTTPYYPEYTADGTLVGYWVEDKKTGAWKKVSKVPGLANGGRGDGLTLTGELGREIAVLPNGAIKMLGEDRGELVDLPKGTQVINNKDTEQILKYAGPIGGKSIRKLADGNVKVTTDAAAAETVSLDAKHVVDNMNTSIRGAVAALTEHDNKVYTVLGSTLDTAIKSVISSINDAAFMVSGNLDSAISSLGSALSMRSSLGSSDSGGSQSVIDEAKREYEAAKAAGDKAGMAAAHAKAEAERAKMGYSGGADGSERIKLNNTISSITAANGPLSAISGLIESAIAASRNINAQQLRPAIGMQNAGVTLMSETNKPAMFSSDPTVYVERVVKKVLEETLPIISNRGNSEGMQPLYVGTLIADDAGLKTLERKLYAIRRVEQTRRE